MLFSCKNQQGKYNLLINNKYFYVFLGEEKPKEWDEGFLLDEFISELIENYITILDSYEKFSLKEILNNNDIEEVPF